MPNIYLDYSLKCINSKPTKGKAPQLEGTFVRREFSLKIELMSFINPNVSGIGGLVWAVIACVAAMLVTFTLTFVTFQETKEVK